MCREPEGTSRMLLPEGYLLRVHYNLENWKAFLILQIIDIIIDIVKMYPGFQDDFIELKRLDLDKYILSGTESEWYAVRPMLWQMVCGRVIV